jgi:type I restriction enzyme M protein
MEMVSKMKPVRKGTLGTRIASVHNGSSLFTGDAGGGESNIRRYIIENDWLEAIVQLPNNLFYNTGITTYIWILSNNKTAKRKGKVQLIDAGQLYRKLRKNLGNKNCEFSPEHITEIVNTYTKMSIAEREGEQGISAQVFDNADFGYYKATIERPKRLKAQFTAERIETLRYDRLLQEPMQYAFKTYGESIYTNTKQYESALLEWCEKNELNLSSANKTKLTKAATWQKHLNLVKIGTVLLKAIGTEEYNDFNDFKKLVDAEIKKQKLNISASDKKAILNAVSWYDANAEKVIKKVEKLSGDKLVKLLTHLDCKEKDLVDFGYYSKNSLAVTSSSVEKSLKKGEYITYETESDLRDTENVPLKDNIHNYFLREVQPHVPEAWINLDATKIGYEISFNKYFYKHTPLRNIEDVTKDIKDLENLSDGLISEILNLV